MVKPTLGKKLLCISALLLVLGVSSLLIAHKRQIPPITNFDRVPIEARAPVRELARSTWASCSSTNRDKVFQFVIGRVATKPITIEVVESCFEVQRWYVVQDADRWKYVKADPEGFISCGTASSNAIPNQLLLGGRCR